MSTASYLTDSGQRLTPNISPVPGVEKPWAVVCEPGTDDEFVWGDFSTFGRALEVKNLCANADVMKRRPDGSLTTEF